VPDDALPGFRLRSEVRGASLQLVASGELDMPAAFRLESRVDPLLSAGGLEAVVLDLGDVEFLDSAGLGALLAIRERAQELGVDMAISRASAAVRRILDVTGTADAFGSG
jgi:anti-anti-sigma factor